MASRTIGSQPPEMAMSREVNEVPAKACEGPGRGSKPEEYAMSKEVNPIPKGNPTSRGRHGKGIANDDLHGGQKFKERREEIRAKRG
jgi:hypothetical protein